MEGKEESERGKERNSRQKSNRTMDGGMCSESPGLAGWSQLQTLDLPRVSLSPGVPGPSEGLLLPPYVVS